MWRNTQFSWRVLSSPHVPLSLSLSCSLSHVVPRRAAHEGENSTAARRHAAEIPDPIQKIYFRNFCWIGDPEVFVDHRTCASTQRCCTCGAGSLHQDLHDLEVGYVGFISNACAGAYNPAIGLQGYVTDILPL